MIYIAASELRSSSRLFPLLPSLYPSFGFKSVEELVKEAASSSLEALTGADVMVTPLTAPVSSSALVKVHIQAGAFLVQLKFGSDLAGSLGGRLKEEIWRMRETGARQAQCILLFIGQVGVDRKGFATIDGQARPKRRYVAIQRAFLRWNLRGGVSLQLSREQYLPEFLAMLGDEDLSGSEYWPPAPEFETGDVLSPLEKVEDWRPVFAAIKGIGPKLATSLRNTMLEHGAADLLAQAYVWTANPKRAREEMQVPGIPGWGEGKFKLVRDALMGEDTEGFPQLELGFKIGESA